MKLIYLLKLENEKTITNTKDLKILLLISQKFYNTSASFENYFAKQLYYIIILVLFNRSLNDKLLSTTDDHIVQMLKIIRVLAFESPKRFANFNHCMSTKEMIFLPVPFLALIIKGKFSFFTSIKFHSSVYTLTIQSRRGKHLNFATQHSLFLVSYYLRLIENIFFNIMKRFFSRKL